MPPTLESIGEVTDDKMSREMGIGLMGRFPFTGTRA
jgi:hypothetical protein